MTTQIHPTAHFHISLPATGETEESLQQKLEQAGLDGATVRAVSALHNGISVTQLLAQGEWDLATGAANCNGSCRAEGENRPAYAELTEFQASELHKDMAKGMDYYRSNIYDMTDGINCLEDFDHVAIERCGHCE